MNDAANAIDDDNESDELDDMNEEEFGERLAEAIISYFDEDDMPRVRVHTFRDAGLLTMNNGLVVRVGDAEFQVQIVRSR